MQVGAYVEERGAQLGLRLRSQRQKDLADDPSQWDPTSQQMSGRLALLPSAVPVPFLQVQRDESVDSSLKKK